MSEEGRIKDSRLGNQKVCGPVEAVIIRQVVTLTLVADSGTLHHVFQRSELRANKPS